MTFHLVYRKKASEGDVCSSAGSPDGSWQTPYGSWHRAETVQLQNAQTAAASGTLQALPSGCQNILISMTLADHWICLVLWGASHLVVAGKGQEGCSRRGHE